MKWKYFNSLWSYLKDAASHLAKLWRLSNTIQSELEFTLFDMNIGSNNTFSKTLKTAMDPPRHIPSSHWGRCLLIGSSVVVLPPRSLPLAPQEPTFPSSPSSVNARQELMMRHSTQITCCQYGISNRIEACVRKKLLQSPHNDTLVTFKIKNYFLLTGDWN